ncbi:WecB/TagA/CpsF family glycosyltransferase [Cohnella suwonensis]|uniref:WecB/TagA/CpsF family glycosyltransferase n=1 Tax=Cohnella suwonensis TaxID=696072 RepID=A0ABW0M5D9_9BACL
MQPIKIAHVHNYYQQEGGEDKVVRQEIEMLREVGHEVIVYDKHNDELKNMSQWKKLAAMIQTVWSIQVYMDFKRFLLQNKPDLVHFHNTFPLISPSAYFAAQKMGIPVVQTLHNYRLLCPAGVFYHHGEVCEKCSQGTLMNSILLGCYRNSRLQSAVVATMLWVNRLLGTWNRKVDRYIVLTEFAKQKFVEKGLPEKKITVKSNFTKDNIEPTPRKEFFLFVGRLSTEKGVDLLVDAWKSMDPSLQLVIIGDGPEYPQLRETAKNHPNIQFLGKQDSSVVMQRMREARFLIVPSIWYEGFPMAVIEAYSVGTPVICNRIGSLQEIVVDSVTGFHYDAHKKGELAQAIQRATEEGAYEVMCANVQRIYRSQYTKELNIARLLEVYDEVLEPANKLADSTQNQERLRSGYILDSQITALSFNETLQQIGQWIEKGISKYVCVCTTHSLVTASQHNEFKQALNQAGICTPDGMPLVWALRALGYKQQERVDGTTLTKELCRLSSKNLYRIYLYGCTPSTLDTLKQKLEHDYPGIQIVGTASPPFRKLDEEEERKYINDINQANPDLVFVALGCPKQEIWMNKNRYDVKGVMIGVGAAFDYLAGNITRPPLFIQKSGLEWLFRLMMEPRRLWKRYLYNNSVFIYKYIKSFHRNKVNTNKLNA